MTIQSHCITFDIGDNNTNIKTINIGDSFYFTFSSANNGVGGVGVIYHQCIARLNPSIKSISDRILQIVIKISADYQYNILSTYCPTAIDSHRQDIINHYETPVNVISQIPNRHILVVTGDMNTMLNESNLSKDTQFSHDQLNNLLTVHDLYPIHKQFMDTGKKLYHFITYYGPNNRTVQLDYILIRNIYKANCCNWSTNHISSINSDHKVIIGTFRFRLNSKISESTNNTNLNYSKLKCDEIGNRVISIFLEKHIDENSYDSFQTAAIESMISVLPPVTKDKIKNPWNDNKIIDLRQHINNLQRKKHRLSRTYKTYSTLSDMIKTSLNELNSLYVNYKRNYLHKQCYRIDKARGYNQSKLAFALAYKISGHKQRSLNTIEANSKEERNQLYCNHFSTVLSTTALNDELNANPPDIDFNINIYENCNIKPVYKTEEFKDDELMSPLINLQNNKATGIDGIPAEFIKLSIENDQFRKKLLNLLNYIYIHQETPTQWHIQILVPVFKKGDRYLLKNYRGIALMSIVVKLYNLLFK